MMEKVGGEGLDTREGQEKSFIPLNYFSKNSSRSKPPGNFWSRIATGEEEKGLNRTRETEGVDPDWTGKVKPITKGDGE